MANISLSPDDKQTDRQTWNRQTWNRQTRNRQTDNCMIHCLLQGRNNFFHAVILFFHHIKVEEKGMLGLVDFTYSSYSLAHPPPFVSRRTNLTLSGLNILTTLEST